VVGPACSIYDLTEFDAVVVVGALYANRWHRDARRFVRRHTAALRQLPVGLVSSGPLDDSVEHRDIAPTKQVAKLANRIGVCGHVTFGGRLSPHATGFPASAMAKTHAGDWRDQAHIRSWVESFVAELESREAARP
jgi:menaquinone-dependent protoporphyrinogen oxidase